MNDNKRYYWIKLKTDFFNQETIDFLLSQKNGCEYIVLYQMLCLNTANNNGEMCSKIGEMIVPYNVDKIVRDTKYFDFDTVTIALGLFKQLGLIYEEEDKILKITNFNEMIGSESKWAEKKRQYREKQKQLVLGQSEDNVRQEIEIDIRDRDKSIDIDNINNNIYTKKSKKEKFGIYGRIELTQEEYNRLIKEFGEEFINKQIELLDEYVESNNNKNKYSNFNLVLRKSIREKWFKQNTSFKCLKDNFKGTEIEEEEKKEAEELLKQFK